MIRTLFDRILCLAVVSLALPCVVLAQSQPLPEDVTLGAFETQGSVTFGYRFTDISGRKQKFTELFNLQQGPRLLDFNLMGKVQEGVPQFADSFSINASGLGGDPFAGGQLTLKKDKLYDLRINYRQSYYYWDRNDDVLLPAGPGQPQWAGLTTNHDWATVRRFGDVNLTIHATNNLRFLFEYGRNSRRGVNYSTRTMDYFGNVDPWGGFERANPYYVEAPIDDHSQRFAGSFSYSLKSWNFHYKLGYQDFRSILNWQNVSSGERSINSSIAATGNELLDFARYFESRELKTPVSEFSFLGRPHPRVDVRGGYVYYRYKGPSSVQAAFDGTARTNSGGTAFAPYSVENNGHADLTEPNHVVDGGISVKITDWWNWHVDYRYSRFLVDSLAKYNSLRDNTIQNEGDVTYQWRSGTHLVDTNMEFMPTRGLIIRPGIRFMSRNVKVFDDGVLDDVRSKKINTVWPVLGAFYQPTKKFSVRQRFPEQSPHYPLDAGFLVPSPPASRDSIRVARGAGPSQRGPARLPSAHASPAPSQPQVLIPGNIPRRGADGDEVRPPVAVDVAHGQTGCGHVGVERLALPLCTRAVGCMVDVQAGSLPTIARRNLVVPVPVEVSDRERMTIVKTVVDSLAAPELAGPSLEIDDDLLPMPGFDGGDESSPVNFTHGHLTRAPSWPRRLISFGKSFL